MPGIELMPENPTAADDLVVEIVTPATDPDGDDVEYQVTWSVDGELLEGVEGLSLEHMFTARGEKWTVHVTSFDGIEGGGVATKSVDIENSRPTIESITVTPMEVFEKTEVSCTYAEPQDLDNDVIDQHQLWSVNGVEVDVGPVLTGEHFNKGDVVSCLVYAEDGIAPPEPRESEQVTVLNPVPAIVGCSFDDEDNAFPEDQPVVVRSNGWNDDDGDPEGYLYAWYVNDELVSEEAVLSPDLFGNRDNIFVEMTAWDGEEAGNMARSPYGTGTSASP